MTSPEQVPQMAWLHFRQEGMYRQWREGQIPPGVRADFQQGRSFQGNGGWPHRPEVDLMSSEGHKREPKRPS